MSADKYTVCLMTETNFIVNYPIEMDTFYLFLEELVPAIFLQDQQKDTFSQEQHATDTLL